MKSWFKKASLYLFATGLACSAQAMTPHTQPSAASLNQSLFFPMNPRLTFSAGTGDFSDAHADLMAALLGNKDGIVYLDAQGNYGHDDAWFGSIGLGGREIIGDQSIIGFYVFGDRSESTNNHAFWDVSPGIEWMDNDWDAHVNGYFPVGNTQHNNGRYFGDQIGISKYVRFDGHTEFDALFNVGESVGSGVDTELGYTIPDSHRIRVFAGSYYFDPRNAEHILGGLAGIQIPMSQHLIVQFDDSYGNNTHNTFMFSLLIRLGGPNKTGAPEIQDRLLDPIPRNLGSRRTGMAIPSKETKTPVNNDDVILERNNVWFFSPNGQAFNPALGTNQGTINNPLSGPSFTQGTVNSIHGLTQDATFFFRPGNYPINNAMAVNEHRIRFFNGQSLFGRNSSYSLPAAIGNRPLFTGGFNVMSHNTLSDFNLTGQGTSESIGIFGNGASNVLINNVNVSNYSGASNTNSSGGNAVGIDLNNATNLTLKNVSVSNITGGNGSNGPDGIASVGSNGANGGNATGIKLDNDTSVLISHVSATNITGGQGGNGGNGSNGTNGASGIPGSNGTAGLAGGNGGDGGAAQGINVSNSNKVTIASGTLSNITGGAAGTGGNGGSGGNGGNGNNAFSSPGAGGAGGAGGDGGSGGAGGASQGIKLSNSSQLTLSNMLISNLTGGAGGLGGIAGNGGNGGIGGTAIAIPFGAIGGRAGAGGAGGSGGSGGAAQGVNVDNSVVKLSNSIISNLTGGAGGAGGAAGHGGNGGNGGGANQAAGGKGGNGGDGGDGGDGGIASGSILSGSSAILKINVTELNLVNGLGALGGALGTGGAGGTRIIPNNNGDNGHQGAAGI